MNCALYNDKYCIGLEELNKIYVSLLTTADKIYLNANVEISPFLSQETNEHINNSLLCLEKEGLLVYWCFPNDKDKHTAHQNLISLNQNEYEMWNHTINTHFFHGDNLKSIFNGIGEQTNSLMHSENTSKILLLRREYWTYATMLMLKATELVNFFDGWMPQQKQIQSINKVKIDDMIIQKLFYEEAASFSLLNGSDIVAFNKKNKKIRDKINNITFFENDSNDISILLNDAIAANKELVEKRKDEISNQVASTVLTVGGYVANLTPLGAFLNILKDSVVEGQGLYSAIKSLYDNNDMCRLTYLLCKMSKRSNKLIKKQAN